MDTIALAAYKLAKNGSDPKKVAELVKQELGSVYTYKGSVDTYDDLLTLSLTTKDVGYVYNVIKTGMNYAWTGTEWDTLGLNFSIADEVTEDGTALVTAKGIYQAIKDISYNDLKDRLVYKEYVTIVAKQEVNFSESNKVLVFHTTGQAPLYPGKYEISCDDYPIFEVETDGGSFDFYIGYNVTATFRLSIDTYDEDGIPYVKYYLELIEYNENNPMWSPRHTFEIKRINIVPLDGMYLPADMATETEVQQMIDTSLQTYDTEIMFLLGGE